MSRVPIVSNFPYVKKEKEILVATVKQLLDSKKGVLGIDEHPLAFKHYFSEINRINDWESRRLYRQLITDAPLQKEFSAALVSEELIKQSDDEAIEFIDTLLEKGLLLGVRIDNGLTPLFGTREEFTGSGMDNITERLRFYKERGCKYSKWRSVYQIKEHCPTLYGIKNNSDKLSKFAVMSQIFGLVPIVSVEVLPDGSADIVMAQRVLQKILMNLIKGLSDYNVLLEAVILQVSFVQPGRHNEHPYTSPESMADITLEVFKKSIPIIMGGIMFHSSGLSEDAATQTLNHVMIRKQANETMVPWKISYSFGRGQQASAVKTWKGDPDFDEVGQNEIMIRAAANNQALMGKYKAGSVRGAISELDLFIPNYTY